METTFQFVEPADVVIAGLPSAGLTIRGAGRTLGRLRGFVVERAHQRIRYLVVRASGLLGKSILVPFSEPRVDIDGRAIDIDIDAGELWQLRDFTLDQLPA